MSDTTPSEFDRLQRKARLQEVANSYVLKLLQYAITAIAVPAIGWSMSTLLERVGKIESSIQSNLTSNATYELRMQWVEQTSREKDLKIQSLNEKVIGHEFEIRNLRAGGK